VDTTEPLGCEQRAGLLDELGQAVIATDVTLRVTYWNGAAASAFGWTEDEMLGRHILDVCVPEFVRSLSDDVVTALMAGTTWSGAFTVRRKDGRTFTAHVTANGIRGEQGDLLGLVATAGNIGQMLRPLMTRSQEVAVVTGAYGVVRFASPAVERILGWTDEDVAGRSLFDLIDPEDRESVEDYVRLSLAHPESGLAAEFRLQTADGEWVWVEGLLADLRDDPSVLGLVWTLRDISARRAALEAMTDLALHDPLTGLANRTLLEDRLAMATARREHHGALLFIDLDDFKQVNDAVGHAGGDELLKTVADRLAQVVRPEDTCSRWSGDEFIVLNESVGSMAEAASFAERVGAAIGTPVEIGGTVLTPEASIGVVMLDASMDPTRVIRLADEQMYVVKERHHAARGH
jgi:diguanylate cyclase (GGDEF)-like protein/PAS domain S-box-containing protein